jgi:hypothetical protein
MTVEVVAEVPSSLGVDRLDAGHPGLSIPGPPNPGTTAHDTPGGSTDLAAGTTRSAPGGRPAV